MYLRKANPPSSDFTVSPEANPCATNPGPNCSRLSICQARSVDHSPCGTVVTSCSRRPTSIRPRSSISSCTSSFTCIIPPHLDLNDRHIVSQASSCTFKSSKRFSILYKIRHNPISATHCTYVIAMSDGIAPAIDKGIQHRPAIISIVLPTISAQLAFPRSNRAI